MVYSFIGTLLYFKVDGDSSYEYTPVTISNSNPEILAKILNEDFGASFGRHGIGNFQKEHAFFYREIPEDDVESVNQGSIHFGEYMEEIKHKFHAFHSFLWFVKDNSVIISNIYGIAKRGTLLGQLTFEGKIIISNCSGEFKQVGYTKDEIDRALNIRSKFYKICPHHKNEDHWGYDREVNRIEKAFKFLCEARAEVYLPARIAMYMSCLECLFSTEPGELTQKISERVAFYIGKNQTERISLFEGIRNAYEIRSRYLHGGVIKKRLSTKDSQISISAFIDATIRRALTKVILEESEKFLLDNEKLDLFLKRLIFLPDC